MIPTNLNAWWKCVIFVCLFTWGLFTRRVRWSTWAMQSLGRLLSARWTQREESSPLQIKKGLADDGHIINGFSVHLELICSDYCPLKGSLFLEEIDASVSHRIPSFHSLQLVYTKINQRSSPCSLYNSLLPQNSAALPRGTFHCSEVLFHSSEDPVVT